MSDFVKEGKVFGIIPVEKYAKITYLMVVGAAVLALLLTVLALGGIGLGINMLVTLVSLIGLLMAAFGLFLLKDVFSALDQNHFMYILVVWVVMFVVTMIFGNALGGYVGLFIVLLLNVASAVLLYTGYNSWSRGRMITKDNISSEIQFALKRS